MIGFMDASNHSRGDPLPALLQAGCEPFGGNVVPPLASGGQPPDDACAAADLQPLLRRIGNAQVVLIGESTHGTSDFYRMRARITRLLVERLGFRIVAVEADWPDAARIDRYVRGLPDPDAGRWAAFSRFPTWMWRNVEVAEFVDWLHGFNRGLAQEHRTGFFGLDVYSLQRSIAAVLQYLDQTDAELARQARRRYGCLDRWTGQPAAYGFAAATDAADSCEEAVVANLRTLLAQDSATSLPSPVRPSPAPGDAAAGADPVEVYLDAVQNARVVANAERYYRTMYRGARASWNLRDTHMFETLLALCARHGQARAVIWAHNSHVGDARATRMGDDGEVTIGSLARAHWGDAAYLIGMGTDTGTVAAASDWDAPMEIKQVRPARADSFEGAMRATGLPAFLLPLRHGGQGLRSAMQARRLERAIGVIYRPETERASHYFEAALADQFDEFIWMAHTHAVTELAGPHLHGAPELYPFAL